MLLEIYCDASIKKNPRTGEYIGCPGAFAIANDGINENIVEGTFSINSNFTNNRSELTAFLYALQLLKKYGNGDNYERVNIYSDSLITVKTFKEWIFKWVNNFPMLSYSGKPVANQDIILNILQYIIYNNLKVNLYHIKGHVNIYNEAELIETRKLFIDNNGIDASLDDIRRFCENNNYVDNYTRDMLKHLDLGYNNYKTYPIFCIPTIKDMEKYSRLINKFGE